MFCWPSLQWCHHLWLQHPGLPVHSVYIWESRGGKIHNEMTGDLQMREEWFCVIIFYWSRASPSHQLPHQPQSQGWNAGVQVMSADSHSGEFCWFAQLNSIVTVLQLVEGERKAGGKRGRAMLLLLVKSKCNRLDLPSSCWFPVWGTVACWPCSSQHPLLSFRRVEVWQWHPADL